MNLIETMKFLAVVSMVDNRRADRRVGEVWQVILHDIPYDYAVEAHIEFRRNSPGVYLEPGHIIQLAKPVLTQNVAMVEGAQRAGLLPKEFDKTRRLSVEQKRLLTEYGILNDRAMVTGMSTETFNGHMEAFRSRWYSAIPAEVAETVMRELAR